MNNLKSEISDSETNAKTITTPQPEKDAVRPQAIGGILVFVAIGLCISLLKNLTAAFGSLALIRASIWRRLTDPDSPVYSPYWKPALIYAAVTNTFILIASAVGVTLFFRRSRLFPKFTVIFIPVVFVLTLGGYYLEGLIPAIAESADYGKEGHALFVKFIALHVWIPYFLLSERVKKTFVK